MLLRIKLVLAVLLLSLASFTETAAVAQEEPSVPANLPYDSQNFRDVAGKLRCPTCTGLSVLDSDAAFSVQIKNQVNELMQQGKSEAEILAFFTERYGPWILREPPKTGFNMLAWAIPIAVLVLGPIIVWAFAWRRKKLVDTHGVRSIEVIAAEMQQELALLRNRPAS